MNANWLAILLDPLIPNSLAQIWSCSILLQPDRVIDGEIQLSITVIHNNSTTWIVIKFYSSSPADDSMELDNVVSLFSFDLTFNWLKLDCTTFNSTNTLQLVMITNTPKPKMNFTTFLKRRTSHTYTLHLRGTHTNADSRDETWWRKMFKHWSTRSIWINETFNWGHKQPFTKLDSTLQQSSIPSLWRFFPSLTALHVAFLVLHSKSYT